MFKRFYPDRYVLSAYVIDYKDLKKCGIKAVIFDIDNTLVRHSAPADEKALALFESLRGMDLKFLFLSNNNEARVAMFNEKVGAPYVHHAGKPAQKGYLKALEILELNPAEVVFVGDQLFTDIWGAKKAGMKTILVKPIHKKEEFQIVLKRILERIVLYFYLRKESAKNI
ncbi:MAG: YqeG family HAD IIIA-type phosphatase [Lachnospiraceae bacterium]|jgi:HAD superfamily phosphatase (TIGR01668 family)|nr:YqeG family HAD IIIA-type phosphatase [Lachnospiraceae bacterium]